MFKKIPVERSDSAFLVAFYETHPCDNMRKVLQLGYSRPSTKNL